jgi:hypothetical protein
MGPQPAQKRIITRGIRKRVFMMLRRDCFVRVYPTAYVPQRNSAQQSDCVARMTVRSSFDCYRAATIPKKETRDANFSKINDLDHCRHFALLDR